MFGAPCTAVAPKKDHMPRQSSTQVGRITEIRVNGRKYSIDADPETPLLTVLREQLDLTGSKYGCGEGQCRRLHRVDRKRSAALLRDSCGRGSGERNHHD